MNAYIILCVLIIIFENAYMFGRKYIVANQRKYLEALIVVIFSLIVAFRPLEVRDTLSYIEIFNSSIDYVINRGFSLLGRQMGFENGWWYLNAVASYVLKNFRLFFFLIALWTCIIIPKYLARIGNESGQECDEGIVRCIYITAVGVLYSGLVLRAGVAISFALIGVYLFRKRKFVFASLMLAFSVLLHNSSLLMVMFAIVEKLFRKQASKRMFRTVIIISLIALLLLFSGFASSLNGFVYSFINNILTRFNLGYFINRLDIMETRLGIIRMAYFVSVIMIFIISKRHNYKISEGSLLIIFSSICIMFFSGAISGASRIYDIPLFFSYPVLGQMFKEWEDKKRLSSCAEYSLIMSLFMVIKFKTAFF